jgi:hypothetical protein
VHPPPRCIPCTTDTCIEKCAYMSV